MALGGRHLKVGAGVWVPWVDLHENPDGSLGYSGLISNFFDEIADRLNFTYTLYRPGDQEWGRGLPNGSFTGLVGMCQRKEVDLVLGPLGISWERFQVADFSETLYVDQYTIFLPRPRLENDLGSITKPLAPDVWIALAVTLCLSMIIAPFMNFILKSVGGTHRNPDDPFIVAEPSWILRIICTETVRRLPSSDSGRLFLGAWMIGGFILHSAYSGVLTSLLSVPKVKVPVDSIQDLVDYGKIPWAIERGTFLDHQIAKSKSGVYKKIHDKASYVEYVYVARNRIKDEGLAVLADTFTMKKIMSEDYSLTAECNYYIAKEHIQSSAFALGFPKGSRLIPHFNKWLGQIKEAGVLQHIMLSVTVNATACLVKPGKERGNVNMAFTVTDFAGIFLLMSAGALIGFGLLLLEKLTHRSHRERPTRN